MKIKEYLLELYENDLDTFKNITQSGCVNGCAPGLIYYHETIAFYDKFKDEIWEIAYDFYKDCEASNLLECLGSLHGAKQVYGEDQFKNFMCWFAVDWVSREIVEDMEQREIILERSC